jgi:ACR3 family arsenite efflux pump ArsB
MLVKVDFGALPEIRQHVRGIGVTLFVNWLVKPFSMTFLGWLLIRKRAIRHTLTTWSKPCARSIRAMAA